MFRFTEPPSGQFLKQSTSNHCPHYGITYRVLKGPRLRRCDSNWKVVGSIPDGAIGIFHSHNLSDRTTTMVSTQPITEMSTRITSWGVKNDRCGRLTDLSQF